MPRSNKERCQIQIENQIDSFTSCRKIVKKLNLCKHRKITTRTRAIISKPVKTCLILCVLVESLRDVCVTSTAFLRLVSVSALSWYFLSSETSSSGGAFFFLSRQMLSKSTRCSHPPRRTFDSISVCRVSSISC